MNRAARVAVLVAVWLLAWGDFSGAQVAAGLVLAAGLLLVFPPPRTATPTRAGVRPLRVVALVGYVLSNLVMSNLLVAREILSRGSQVRTGVIAHRLATPSDLTLTLVANIIALTPGTMTVEVTRDPAVVYVHFLLLADVDEARRTIARLEELTVAAFPPRAPARRPGAAA